jgi:hypothetical protein
LKKRTKKLLIIESRASQSSAAQICKSFLLLFSKKKSLLPYLCARRLEGAGARSGCFSSTLAL